MPINHFEYFFQNRQGVTPVFRTTLPVSAILLLWASHAPAADKLTKAMIREVMDKTDVASVQRDTEAIGAALGSEFYRYIEIPSDGLPAAARITKAQYLKIIDEGWEKTSQYQYQRKDVVVNLSPEGDSGESFSTIIETFVMDGKEMVSKIREYARYELEDGRPVIVNIDTQTLVGDSTPGQ